MTSISLLRSGLPSRSQRHVRTRAVSAVLAASGLTMLVAPEWVVRRLTPDAPEPRSWIVRLLGARSLVQNVLIVIRPTRQAMQLGAAVDGLHAASMVGVAALSSRFRRPAAVSAGIATVSALVDLAVAPQSDDEIHVPGDVEL